MKIIAAGLRQVHEDQNGKKFVKFDQGIYNVPDKAQTTHQDGADWVWCEAHADEETGDGWAEIAGKKQKLAFNPFESSSDDE